MPKTIHQLPVVTTAASGDEVAIWRAANSDTKRITKANFVGATITGGGTLATGGFTLTVGGTSSINGNLSGPGFTLTVPATGTAALRDVANTFTQANTFAAATFGGATTFSAPATHTGQLNVNQFLVLTAANATLASDAITATATLMVVDTEAAAATDTLSTINGGIDGALIIIRQSNSARDILIDMTAGNIRNHSLGNRQMSDNSYMWLGMYKSAVSLWLELAWAN